MRKTVVAAQPNSQLARGGGLGSGRGSDGTGSGGGRSKMSSREEQPFARVKKQVRVCRSLDGVWPAPDAKIEFDRPMTDETYHQFRTCLTA